MIRYGARLVAGVAAVMLAGSLDAAAQSIGSGPWDGIGYFTLNVGIQNNTREFSDEGFFTVYEEGARFTLPYEIGGGTMLDLGGGVRVWKNLAVGLNWSAFQDTLDTTIDARIPHPILFNQPRTAEFVVNGLDHEERALSLVVSWMLPFNDRLQVRAFAGPAFFNVKQDAVASPLTFQEVGPPFTSVTITGAPVVELEDTGTGATVGAEVDFMVTRHVGAGLMVRYSGATVELNLPASEDQLKLSVGGFQIGFGARVRF